MAALWDEDYGGAEAEEDAAVVHLLSRLSEILPRRLRFSESWALKKGLQLKLAGRGNATFRADEAGDTESGPLKVFVRLRPPTVKGVAPIEGLTEEAIKATSDVELTLEPPQNAKRVFKPLPAEKYTFTRVFNGTTSQQAYFKATAEPVIADMLAFRFRNSVIMAYGSSGAGKTYTIEGPHDDPGLLPQSISAIFQSLEQQPGQYRILISFYEVYNDVVYDLLSSNSLVASSTAGQQQQQRQEGPGRQRQAAGVARRVLRVREDACGRVHIPGLLEVPCSRASEVLELHKRAARMRQQACTGVNSTSSRSHCIFTVKLEEASAASSSGRSSQLSFVDLAGSERAARTKNTGNRLKESVAINSSLMTLGRCLEALKCNQSAPAGAPARCIPFRESKITHIFKDALHGWGHLVLAVCVSPVAADYEETHHVIKYAAQATAINLAIVAPDAPELPPAAAGAASIISMSLVAAPGGAGGGSSTHGAHALQSRVAELEAELGRVYEQLQEAEAHLVQAEADIRDEVVGEIQGVIRELRAGYEARMADMAEQLAQRDARVLQLEQELAAAQLQRAQGEAAAAAPPEPAAAAAAPEAAQQGAATAAATEEARATAQDKENRPRSSSKPRPVQQGAAAVLGEANAGGLPTRASPSPCCEQEEQAEAACKRRRGTKRHAPGRQCKRARDAEGDAAEPQQDVSCAPEEEEPAASACARKSRRAGGRQPRGKKAKAVPAEEEPSAAQEGATEAPGNPAAEPRAATSPAARPARRRRH